MEITRRGSISLTFVIAVLVPLAAAQAPGPRGGQTVTTAPPPGQSAGRVSAVIPKATRTPANSTVPRVVQARDPLAWNDVLKTDKNGRLRVSLEDGSILALGGNSQMRVLNHNPAAQQTQVELAFGNLRSTVAALTQPGARFEVRTPTAVAGVLGTDFITLATNNSTNFRCISGTLNVTTNNFGSVILNAGQQVTATATGLGAPTNVAGGGGGGQGGQGGQGQGGQGQGQGGQGGGGGGGGAGGGGAGGAGGAGGGIGGAAGGVAGGVGGAAGAAAGVAANSAGANGSPNPASPQ